MKSQKLILFVLAILFVLFFVPTKAIAVENDFVSVKFKDVNLFNAVLEQTSTIRSMYDDKTNEIFYTKENLDNITYLNLASKNITDISGLESFSNLKTLYLSNNNISDLSPLSSSISLTALHLVNNKVSNVAYLINLENLKQLSLNNNDISDALPLGYLKNLNGLYLSNNKIKDISTFDKLTSLTTLYMDENKVSDITPLQGLANLKTVSLKKQAYEFDVEGYVLCDSETNIDLPKFFVQSQEPSSLIYTSNPLVVSGAKLSNNSKYIIVQSNLSGNYTAQVTIMGGIADGSTAVIKYNSVKVSIVTSTMQPEKIYEKVGGTISYTVNVAGETNTTKLSIEVLKNGSPVTGTIGINRYSGGTPTSTRFAIIVFDTITSGVYTVNIKYDGKTALSEQFTIYESVPATGISLNASNITLDLGQTTRLIATVYPENALNKGVYWKSENPNVATVDAYGNVTAVGYGFANITVLTADGSKQATCTINVPQPTPSPTPIPTPTITPIPTPVPTPTSYSITSSVYTIEGSIIKGIEPSTYLSSVIRNLNIPTEYSIYDLSRNTIFHDSFVGTGYTIRLANGTTYTFVVKGDLNGDGKLTGTDILKIKTFLVELETLSDVSLKAADLNNNGSITSTDLMLLKQEFVNLV